MSNNNTANDVNDVGGGTQPTTDLQSVKKIFWDKLICYVVSKYNQALFYNNGNKFEERKFSKKPWFKINRETIIGSDGELYDGCSYEEGCQLFNFDNLVSLQYKAPDNPNDIISCGVEILTDVELNRLCTAFCLDPVESKNKTIMEFLREIGSSLNSMNEVPDASFIDNGILMTDEPKFLKNYIENFDVKVAGKTFRDLQENSYPQYQSKWNWKEYLMENAQKDKKKELKKLLKYHELYPGNSRKNIPWYEKFTDWINRKWFRWMFKKHIHNHKVSYQMLCGREWDNGNKTNNNRQVLWYY